MALPALYGWLQSPAATPTQVYQVQAVGAVAEPWPQFVVTQGATAPGAEPQSQLQRALTAGSLSTLLGVISSLGAFLRSQGGTQRSRLPTSLLVALGTTALVFGVLLLAYTGYVFIDRHLSSPWTYGLAALACLGAALLGGLCVITNYLSVHRYYRDRLMETFMPDVGAALPMDGVPKGLAQDADTKELHRVWPPTGRAAPGPYPLINAHVMLVSSRIPKFRGRGGDSFVFSPWYSGSNATGWARTSRSYRWMTLASAMAVSGAAVNPNTGVGGSGVTRQPMLSLLMGLLNIRLAYGVLNPMPRPQRLERMQHQGQPAWRRAMLVLAERLCKDVPNAIWPGLAELLLRSDLDENSHMLQLTDGGHFENLGLYELVRRRVPLIIASDAGADPGYGFGDLANAIEKVRADFGVLIDISAADLERLTPGRVPDRDPPLTSVAERGFLVARVLYPEAAAQPMVGTLIYMTTTFFKELSADLYGYKRNCPDFPDQPTSDQFFNEQQFDAYRELGYQTAWQMLQSAEVRTLRPVLRRMGLPPWEPPDGR